MKVIFLDVDGVLNSQRYKESGQFGAGASNLEFGRSQIDPEAVARLDRLIDATGARVVVSSSWRHFWSLDEIRNMLAERGLRNIDALMDITPSMLSDRGSEIGQWLGIMDEARRYGGDDVEAFVILDDDTDFDERDMFSHLVRVNPDVGLTDDDVRRAVQILEM